MSLCSRGPEGSTGTGTITAPARGVGASLRPPSLQGISSGADLKRWASTGRCQIPCRPGRLPAAGASKRIAPGTGPSSAAVVLEESTARGRCSRMARIAARRAFGAQASSSAANVRSSGGRRARHISTRAPARRSDPASSSSASRRPAVPPRETIRTSARAIGVAFWRAMEIAVLPDTLAVCRLRASERIPSWALELHEGFVSVTRTPGELSIVCDEEAVPPDVEVESGWRALQLPGPIPFEQTGVLASLASPLAAAGIPIFAISTFETDYVLVRAQHLERALETLNAAPGRRHISSGSPFEPVIGFSRAVRDGDRVLVSGTGPVMADGSCPPTTKEQALRCWEIVLTALDEAGAGPADVVRTRTFLTPEADADGAMQAHGEVFGDVRPASTMLVIPSLVDARWTVEVEAEAVTSPGGRRPSRRAR